MKPEQKKNAFFKITRNIFATREYHYLTFTKYNIRERVGATHACGVLVCTRAFELHYIVVG